MILVREAKISTIDDSNLNPVRGDITKDIVGRSLIPESLSKTSVTYTKVGPSGRFEEHVDDYHHVLLFPHGHGILYIDKHEYAIEEGMLVEIPAGTPHGYQNITDEDMLLITINIPVHD